jgi:hypothetical protein
MVVLVLDAAGPELSLLARGRLVLAVGAVDDVVE